MNERMWTQISATGITAACRERARSPQRTERSGQRALALGGALTVALLACAGPSAQGQVAPSVSEGTASAVPLALAAPVQPLSAYVREVFQDRAGNHWFGTNDEGIARYDGSALVFLNTTHGLAGNAVRGIVQSADGAIWIATDGGVSRYLDGRFRTFTAADGLSDASLWSILLDRSGTIWVGTHEGVCRLVGERFVPFPLPRVEVAAPASRFSPKVVFAMCEDRAGHLWFGTDGEGVHRFDGRSFTSYSTADGLGGMMIRAIHEDRRGRIWIGSDGGGVSCYDGTAFRTFTSRDGLSNDRVFEILEDRAGTLWLSTLGDGLTRSDGTTFSPVGKESGLSFDEMPCACGSGRRTKECHAQRGVHVQDIVEDREGRLWFGCSGGLFRREGDAFVHVTRSGPWRSGAAASMESPVPTRLASFARMIGGEWRVTFESGTKQFDRWRWGPGRRSVVAETYGSDAAGGPWRVLSVYSIRPDSGEVRFISLHPRAGELGYGLAEGTTVVDGERMATRMTLRQSGRAGIARTIESRMEFRNPDVYRAALLEDSGRGPEEFVAWEYTRSYELSPMPAIVEGAERPTGRLAFAGEFLGPTWSADGRTADGERFGVTASFDWIPYIGVLHAQVVRSQEVTTPGSAVHRSMEVFLMPSPSSEAVRVLVLTETGGVLEGDATVVDGRRLTGVLTERDGDRVVQRAMEMGLEANGAPRLRLWSEAAVAGPPLLDLAFRR